MTNSDKLLHSLYTLVFFSENVNIILLNNKDFKNDDISRIRTEQFNIIKNEEVFYNVYPKIKENDKDEEILDLSKINMNEMFDEISNINVTKHNFSGVTQFNIDIKNKIESIINTEIDSFHLIMLEPELFEKLNGLFKSVNIDSKMSLDQIISSIKKSYINHKEKKLLVWIELRSNLKN